MNVTPAVLEALHNSLVFININPENMWAKAIKLNSKVLILEKAWAFCGVNFLAFHIQGYCYF